MPLPKPIRYDVDTWLCMRGDPVLPKAIIRLLTLTVDGRPVKKYRAVTWELESQNRQLIGYFDTLEQANNRVLFDVVEGSRPGPVNGITASRRDTTRSPPASCDCSSSPAHGWLNTQPSAGAPTTLSSAVLVL